MSFHSNIPQNAPVQAPSVSISNPDVPSDNPLFTNYYAQNNFIGAGVAGEIVDSQRCSIINGANNLISGKYNAHVIGDYMGLTGYTDIEDNSFNVGCHNGMVVYGDVLAKRRVVSNYNIEVGPGTAGFAFIDLKNDVSEDADIRIAQGVNSQSEYDLYIGPAPNSPQACNLHVEGDVVSYYASDKRLKDDITLIDEPLSKVMSLDAIQFNWNDNQSTYTGHDIGLIAQQVEEVAPEIVQTRKDGYKAIKYEKVNALLVGAIQEQQKKIEFLEKRLESLERRSSRS